MFDIYEINGVPNEDVPDVVADLQADPRFVSHQVIPEGVGTSTIIAVFRKASAMARTATTKKPARKKNKVGAKKKKAKKKKKSPS